MEAADAAHPMQTTAFGQTLEAQARRIRELEQRCEYLEKLAETNARYSLLLNTTLKHIPEGITIAEGPDARITHVSSFGVAITGRPESELHSCAGTHIPNWGIHRADGTVPDCDDELPLTRACRFGESTINQEWQLARPDGSRAIVLCNAAPIRDAHGKVTGGILAWRDITERKAQQKFISDLIEAAPTITYLFDVAAQRNLFISRQCIDVLGYTPEEIQAMGDSVMATLLHPDDVAAARAAYDRMLASGVQGGIFEIEYRMRRKDGSWVWLFSRDRLIEGHRILGVALDISHRREIEESLRRANSDLSEFAHTVSHDLREPLRAMRTCTELIRRRYKHQVDPESHQLFDFVSDGAARMERIVSALLDFSRAARTDSPPAAVDAQSALSEALSNLAAQVQESSARISSCQLPCVGCAPGGLTLIFQNLVSNAIRYARPEVPPQIHISAQRTGERTWTFAVRDNGLGIDAQHHSRIFDMFTRLHGPDVTGTGIGLATVRRIIERSGGRIWLHSEPGAGSTFFFTLSALDGGQPGA